MTIRVFWDNDDNTILRCAFEPGWTWAMLDEAMRECALRAGTEPRTVDLIFDLCRARTVPEGVMLHLRRVLAQVPKNTGCIVAAGASPAIETAFSVLTQIHKPVHNRLFAVATLDAARAILARPRAQRYDGSRSRIANYEFQNPI